MITLYLIKLYNFIGVSCSNLYQMTCLLMERINFYYSLRHIMLFIIFIGSYRWGSLKNNFTREKFIFVLGNSYNRKTTCCILCTNDKNSWLPQGRLWGVLPAWICLLVLWHALYQNNFSIFYYIIFVFFVFLLVLCLKWQCIPSRIDEN